MPAGAWRCDLAKHRAIRECASQIGRSRLVTLSFL
jgi:hypothetical protein